MIDLHKSNTRLARLVALDPRTAELFPEVSRIWHGPVTDTIYADCDRGVRYVDNPRFHQRWWSPALAAIVAEHRGKPAVVEFPIRSLTEQESRQLALRALEALE